MAPLQQHVGRGDHPRIRCPQHRCVVAGAEQDIAALGKPGCDPVDESELAEFLDGDSGLLGRRAGTVPATPIIPLTSIVFKEEDAMVQAYVLVQTEVGRAASVAEEITDIDGVSLAEDVTGPYDVIVRAEASNMDDLGKLVIARIQGVQGITRTLTCPIVHV